MLIFMYEPLIKIILKFTVVSILIAFIVSEMNVLVCYAFAIIYHDNCAHEMFVSICLLENPENYESGSHYVCMYVCIICTFSL